MEYALLTYVAVIPSPLTAGALHLTDSHDTYAILLVVVRTPGVLIRLCAFCLLSFGITEAQGAVLVSEGVSYNSQTQRFTYRYAIDNRSGTETVLNVAVLVAREAYLWDLPPLEHTSPAGWTFVTAVGSGYEPKGTFQEWNNNANGVPPHAYLGGFSLTTRYRPTSSVEQNYRLLRYPSGEFDKGIVPAPAIPPFPPEPSIPTLSLRGLMVLGLILSAVGMRLTSALNG